MRPLMEANWEQISNLYTVYEINTYPNIRDLTFTFYL